METNFILPQRLDPNSAAVWEEFKEMTAKYGCISLGEGAPASNPPQFLVDELSIAIKEGNNQYTRALGNPALCQKVAQVYGKRFNRSIDAMTEVIVGIGAYQVLSNLLLTLVDPTKKEEVIVFEPSYPCYFDHIALAGGVAKSSNLVLRDGSFHFDAESFRSALTAQTKVLILNNAQNPTGKIFTKGELEEISKILEDFPQVIVIADDVYDFLTFDDKPFETFAAIGNNFNRTVTVYSGGKLFNCTGWKCGWGIGPAHFIKPAGLLNYGSIYCGNHPTQVAMAKSLEKAQEPGYNGTDKSYSQIVQKEFQDVRDYMSK